MGSNGPVEPSNEPVDLEPRRDVRLGPLLLLAALAFVLRWINVAALGDSPLYRVPHGDGLAYLTLAASLREGGIAGLFSEGQVYYQAPLYPHVLALFQWLFGESLGALRIFQAVLGGASVHLMGFGTARQFGQRAGVAAAFLLAFFGPSIWLDGLVQKSALTTLLVCAVIALWSYTSTRATVWMGVTLGLLMLTRGEARLFGVVVAVALCWRGGARSKAAAIAPFACGLAAVLLPVFVRNGVLGGDWVLTTSQAGTNFYIGNRASGTGSYTPLVAGRGDARFEAADAKALAQGVLAEGALSSGAAELTPSGVSAHWRARAFADMSASPGDAVKLLGKKGMLAVSNAEVADTDDFYHAQRSSWVLRLTLPFAALFALAALGLAVATPEERRRGRIFLALAATQWIALVAFYVFARYRLPMTLLLIPLAGLGAARWERARSRPVPALVAISVALLLALIPVWDKDQGTAAALANEGRVLMDAEDFEGATLAAEEAIYLAPKFFDGHRLAALVQLKQGQTDEALPSLETAHLLVPGDWQVRTWLGIAMGEKGELPRAYGLLRGAALERPEALPIVSNAVGLAVALAKPAEAIELLRKRFAAFPNEPDEMLRLQLGWLLSTNPDARLRNGAEALDVLRPLGDTPQVLDVRAAALAETGEVEAALELTTNPEHRATYASGKAWRE